MTDGMVAAPKHGGGLICTLELQIKLSADTVSLSDNHRQDIPFLASDAQR